MQTLFYTAGGFGNAAKPDPLVFFLFAAPFFAVFPAQKGGMAQIIDGTRCRRRWDLRRLERQPRPALAGKALQTRVARSS